MKYLTHDFEGAPPAPKVKATLAREEKTDPMRRRTLLTGLTGLTGTAVFGVPPRPVAAADDSVSALERALLDPPPPPAFPLRCITYGVR